MIKELKRVWKRINKTKLTILILKVILVIGVVGIIFNLGRIYQNKKYNYNLTEVVERHNEAFQDLKNLYEEKCDYCEKNHYELIRFGE